METDKNILNRLVDFGLNKPQSKIYLHLIKHKEGKRASKIAYATGLHRQYIYRSLPELMDSGLVSKFKEGKTTLYKAEHPKQFRNISRKRSLEAYDLSNELKKIGRIEAQQDYEVIEGRELIVNYELNYIQTVNKGLQEYVIGGMIDNFKDLMGESLDYYLETKEDKRINVKYIGGPLDLQQYKDKFKTYDNQSHRFLKKLPEESANIVVREGTVLFYSYADEPLLYVIKSKQLYDHYKKFFEMLWDMAEEFEF